MICSNCGKRNDPQNKVCVYCGAKLPDSMRTNGFTNVISNADVDKSPSNNFIYQENTLKSNDKYQKNKSNKIISIVAIVISIITLLFSVCIYFLIDTKINKMQSNLDEINEQYSELINIEETTIATTYSETVNTETEINSENEDIESSVSEETDSTYIETNIEVSTQ